MRRNHISKNLSEIARVNAERTKPALLAMMLNGEVCQVSPPNDEDRRYIENIYREMYKSSYHEHRRAVQDYEKTTIWQNIKDLFGVTK